MSSAEFVRVERDGRLGIVTLDRPDARNALNEQIRRELIEAFRMLDADDTVRAVLVEGNGKSFCAGADIGELERRSVVDTAWYPERVDKVVEAMRKPVIGALHGHVLGGGLELALSFAIRIAADNLKCGFPELKLGVFPGLGGTQRLPRLIGEGRALDLILTGRFVEASEALDLGLVTRVVPATDLPGAARELAHAIAGGPPIAMACVLESVRRAFGSHRDEGLEIERRLFGIVCGTSDKAEGIAAWREKRTPDFTGK